MHVLALAAALDSSSPAATPFPSSTRLLGLIRARFRSHRPPPPYVVYTISRSQLTDQGYPDYVETYKEHIWLRSSDRAALSRRIYRSINRGDLTFEPAPLPPHPLSDVPTPEPEESALPVIGIVVTIGEFDYRVVSTDIQGDELHLVVEPTRDPDRNRLRELWVDRKTLDLRKVVATDKLFILGTNDVYGVTFTISLDMFGGIPVVTAIHGVVGDGYSGDGATVDYTFTDISFPATLPAWYFDPKQYAAHRPDAPL